MEETSKGQVGFKTVQLFKDQKLGVGSYGAVYKAKCDELVCAAKILHPNLFDIATQSLATATNEHKLLIRRFEQEYKFMSSLRHPNIVQYLGIDHDPDTCFPVLLMELMDDCLTHFLENSTQSISYHIQVNFCHDIALALSFLHSNNIVHRDLSGNNVLLLYNVRVKVTDFGMARLDDFTNKSRQTCMHHVSRYRSLHASRNRTRRSSVHREDRLFLVRRHCCPNFDTAVPKTWKSITKGAIQPPRSTQRNSDGVCTRN